MSFIRDIAGVVVCAVALCGCRSDERGLAAQTSGSGGLPDAGATGGVSGEGSPPVAGRGDPTDGSPALPPDAPAARPDALDAIIPASDSAADGGATVSAFPPAGNPAGKCAIPLAAQVEDVSTPRSIVGSGTRESCTSDAFVDAVAKGGVITFDCGPDPVTIAVTRTAKIVNDTGPRIVIDGGGKVTLNGGGKVRILYQNTCDAAQKWTTDHCDDQDHPQLTVQNLTFVDGSAQGQEPRGGGAILAMGGRLKVVNCRFIRNVCDEAGPVTGGGAIHAYAHFHGGPVYVVNSTFGGQEGLGNACSNGGAINAFGVSFTIINSLFTHNRATGSGGTPPRSTTPGGGSGGAIYTDVGSFDVSVCGTNLLDNAANETGGAVFFNSAGGTLSIIDSVVSHNRTGEIESDRLPGIYMIAGEGPLVTNSQFE
jgi:hypothetical protein